MDTTPFSLNADTEIPLRGYIHGHDHRGAVVIMVHGFKGFCDWGFFPYSAAKIAAHGHTVVRFNFTHNGLGADTMEEFSRLDLFSRNTFSREVREIGLVCDYFKTQYPSRPVYLLGHSRGGGMSLLATGLNHVEGVVTWAGIDTVRVFDEATIEKWRAEGVIYVPNGRTGQQMPLGLELLQETEQNPEAHDILKRAQQFSGRALHLHGDGDRVVFPAAAHRLSEAGGGTVHILDDCDHALNASHPFRNSNKALDQALDISLEFLKL